MSPWPGSTPVKYWRCSSLRFSSSHNASASVLFWLRSMRKSLLDSISRASCRSRISSTFWVMPVTPSPYLRARL